MLINFKMGKYSPPSPPPSPPPHNSVMFSVFLFVFMELRIDGLFRTCIKFEKSEMIKINKIIRRETNFNDLLRACADRNTTLLLFGAFSCAP